MNITNIFLFSFANLIFFGFCTDYFLDNNLFSNTADSFMNIDELFFEISNIIPQRQSINIWVMNSLKPYILANSINLSSIDIQISPQNPEKTFTLLINSSDYSVNLTQTYMKIVNSIINVDISFETQNIYPEIFLLNDNSSLIFEVFFLINYTI